jgi:hypothetical protein
MKVHKMDCVSCGAPIQIPADSNQLTCSHCGATLAIEREGNQIELSIIERLNKSIGEEGEHTRAKISKLETMQELASLRLQLTNMRAETRSLEREKRTHTTERQLTELHSERKTLENRIELLENSIRSDQSFQGAGESPKAGEETRVPEVAVITEPKTPETLATRKKRAHRYVILWAVCLAVSLISFCSALSLDVAGENAGIGLLSLFSIPVWIFLLVRSLLREKRIARQTPN